MCRTMHAVLQTVICGIQMLVRVFMTIILMLENLIRMILQTLYNFISFLLQMLSLIPICAVFLVTARLKCFMCGGGGPCPVNRGGGCDCLMSAVAIIIIFFIFRATGVLDKLFFSLGYTKARPMVYRFVPTPGDITECSRNDTDYTDHTSNPALSSATFQGLYDYEMSDVTEFYTSTYLHTTQTSDKMEEYLHTTAQSGDKVDELLNVISTVTNKASGGLSESEYFSNTPTHSVAVTSTTTEMPPAAYFRR